MESASLEATIEHTIGAYFLGSIASVGLSGLTTLQSWLYFQKYPQDLMAYKLLVAYTWALEIIRSCIAIHASYYSSVQNWGNVLVLLQPVWSMKVMILLTHLVKFGVHSFFIHKVWKVNRGRAKVLCSIIGLFVLGDFASGLAAYITAELETNLLEMLHGKPQHFILGALSCAISSEWLITYALVRSFRESKTQFHGTNYILKRLIFYAINLGLLLSITDTMVLILAVAPWSTPNLYQLAVYEIVGNLYANTLLACLNARDEPSLPSSNGSSGYVGTAPDSLNHTGRTIQIQLSHQTWTSSEPEVSLPTPEPKPQAAMFTHTAQSHPVDSG